MALRIGYLLEQHVEIRQPPFGGPANHVREVVAQLLDLGHEVRVLAEMDGRYWKTDDLIHFEPVSVSWLDKGPFRWLEQAVRRLQYELKLPYFAFFDSVRFAAACRQLFQGSDIFLERMSWMRYGGALASKFMNIPLVLENNGDHLADLEAKGIAPQGVQRKVSLFVTRWAIETAGHIAVSGDGWRHEFQKRWGTDDAKLSTVENGTRLVESLCRDDLRSFGAGAARDGLQLVYLGGFYPWQGVLLLLRAFSRLIEQGLTAHLILIGSGMGVEAAEQLVAEQQLSPHVTFTGRLAPAAYGLLLADADMGLAPYCGWPEFSGLKTFDYKAAGLPIISTGRDGMPSTLVDGRTGIIIPPCDEEALVAAIAELAADTDRRRRLGQAARLSAERDNTWEETVQRLVAIFAGVTSGTTRERPEEKPTVGVSDHE